MKISTKLILLLVAAVVVVMAVYALVTISRTQDRLATEMLKMGEHVGLALSVGVLHHVENGDVGGVEDVLEVISQYEDIKGAAVFDGAGRLVAASRAMAAELEGEEQHYTDPVGTGRITEEAGAQIYTYITGMRNRDGQHMGSLRLILGHQSLLPYVFAARNDILATIAVLTGVIAVLVIFFSHREIAGPLGRLTEGAEAIGQGQLDRRIDVGETGEVGILAAAFNQMAANLEASTREIIAEREYIRSIVDSMAEGIVVLNRDGHITGWNRTMEQRHGLPLEEVAGRPLARVLPDLPASSLREGFRGLVQGELPGFNIGHVTLSAAPDRVLLVTGSPLRDAQDRVAGAVLVLADVTERTRMEKQMQQSEKMAAVGGLAAGVAHEIGTPLNVISGSAEYLLMDLDEGDGRAEELKTIVAETGRITELVKQLMTFARHEEPREEAVDVGELMTRMLVLLRGQLDKGGVQVEVDLAPDLPDIAGDRDQIQQVLLNLVMNAWHAMPDGGRLTLQGAAGPEDPAGNGQRCPSGWVALTVEDTGIGIPEADRQRIFDPFFTTKEVGEGTGLGLAIVQRIVENHGGWVNVRSREGEGSSFVVLLPAASKENGHV